MDFGISLTTFTDAGLTRIQPKLPELVLDADAHRLMKRELHASTDGISSSNLAEALARGLGLRTSGAVKPAIDGSERVAIDWIAAREFVTLKGLKVSPEAFLRSMAVPAMQKAISLEPDLTVHGIGSHCSSMRFSSYEDAVEREQRGLLDSVSLVGLLAALAVVQNLEPQKSLNPSATARRLTKLIERSAIARDISRFNLVFAPQDGYAIAATLYSGFQMAKVYLGPYADTGLGDRYGAVFNITEESLLALEA